MGFVIGWPTRPAPGRVPETFVTSTTTSIPGPRPAAVGAGVLLALLLLAAAGLAEVLIHPDRVLDFNDGNIESVLGPTYRLPGALLRVWDNQFFFGQGGKAFTLSTASLGEWAFGPHHYRREFVALLLGLVGGAVYWMLRQFGTGRPAAALSAAFVMLGGSCLTFAALGLTTRAASLGLAALAVGFMEVGRREDRALPYALGGGALGLAITEVPDIGVFFALTTAAIFAVLHWPRHAPPALWGRLAGRFALFVASSVLLAWQTLNVMLATQVEGVQQGAAEDPSARYEWATQWSLPPAETWNLVAGSYFGTTQRSGTAPYRGRIGRTPGWESDPRRGFRNFNLTGHHWGVAPAALLIAFALWAPRSGRGRWAWMSLAGMAVCLVLAWGRYTPLYRLVWSLPYLHTVRNPEKWMMPFLLFAAPAMGMVLDALREDAVAVPLPGAGRARRAFLATLAGLAGVAFLLLISDLAGKEGFVAAMSAEQYTDDQALAAWGAAVRSSLKVTLLAGTLAAVVWVFGRSSRAPSVRAAAVLGAVAAAGLVDLFAVNAHFVAGRRYRHVLEPNPLSDFIARRGTEGRFSIFPPEHPVLNHLRMTDLQVSGADLFNPVSVSRMPTDYAALFDALQTQPMKLWSLGSVRFFVTLPGGVEQLERADGARGRVREVLRCGLAERDGGVRPVADGPPEQQVLRIAEFSGVRPRAFVPTRLTVVPADADGERRARERLAAPDFDPLIETVVHSAGALPPALVPPVSLNIVRDEPAAFAIELEAASDTVVVRTTRFDPDWIVRVGGRPVELLRADVLLQAVVVPAGRHRVEWEYRPDRAPLIVAVAGRVCWLVALAAWGLRRRG